MQNYITDNKVKYSDIQIIKDGVVTTLNKPSCNGRIKLVNGVAVVKEQLPLVHSADIHSSSCIDIHYTCNDISMSECIVFCCAKMNDSYGLVAVQDDTGYAFYRSSTDYDNTMLSGNKPLVVPCKGKNVDIVFKRTLTASTYATDVVNNLQLWSFI